MGDIAGIPFIEASFDKKGELTSEVTLPAGITDLLVVSHGWNNSRDDALTLYRTLFLAAALLFVMTFIINTVAEIIRQRLRERYKAI